MKTLRIEQERDRRETSILPIEGMGDYNVIRMDMGMNKGGTSDDRFDAR